MACDEPARAHNPALGAAAVERTRARRRRGGRLSKPSVSVEAPHLVVERTRRGSPRPSTVSRAGSTACVGDAAVTTGPSARARSTSTLRRTPRAAYDSATARRSSRAHRTSSGRVELLSNEPHALGRREPLRVDAARRDTSSTSTSRLADEACAGSTATNPCHRRDVVPKRVFAMEWKVEYLGASSSGCCRSIAPTQLKVRDPRRRARLVDLDSYDARVPRTSTRGVCQ